MAFVINNLINLAETFCHEIKNSAESSVHKYVETYKSSINDKHYFKIKHINLTLGSLVHASQVHSR